MHSGVGAKYTMRSEFFVFIGFTLFSVFMTVQDIKTQKVSRWCSIVLLIAMVAARLFFCVGEERVGFVASAAIGLLVFEAVRLVTKKKLGLADVFYSGSVGALLGFNYWLATCAIACVAAAGLIYFRVRKAGRTGEDAQAEKTSRKVSKDARNPPETGSAARTVLMKDAVLRMPVPFIPCMFLGAIVAKIISFL